MLKPRKFEIGQEYHLYARGVDKRDSFLSEHDYMRFMALLHVCNQRKRVVLGKINRLNFHNVFDSSFKNIVQIDQYCLMPNHFHIRCTEIEKGGISKFMQKVLTGYTIFFNKKYNRDGALFSTTFKTKNVNNDLYRRYLRKYIFYNPLKLIRENYSSKKILLLNEEEVLEDELLFLKEYPYKFSNQ